MSEFSQQDFLKANELAVAFVGMGELLSGNPRVVVLAALQTAISTIVVTTPLEKEEQKKTFLLLCDHVWDLLVEMNKETEPH